VAAKKPDPGMDGKSNADRVDGISFTVHHRSLMTVGSHMCGNDQVKVPRLFLLPRVTAVLLDDALGSGAQV
jgi:hypothetical protein